ncbi:MAG: hydrogenase maturation nickel metallochaperone HypA [bacterium]|nr:hydrogenase maturation nickel metallochaperone HypA [bacterium]
MHEYSIVQALMSQVETEARKHGAVSVDRIELKIGELSGIEVDLLRTAFEVFRDRSICARAELEIEVVPAEWSCPTCRELLEAGARLQCPDCKQPARLLSGDEIVLQRIEMEAA